MAVTGSNIPVTKKTGGPSRRGLFKSGGFKTLGRFEGENQGSLLKEAPS